MSFLWFHCICTQCNKLVRLDETLMVDAKPVCHACHERLNNTP